MRPPVLALLLVLPALLAPAAAGDHVFSHRFVFEGRLLGSDDLPLPGRVVEFFARGDEFLQACADQPQQPVTDEWGDFRFCFHKHDLTTSTVVGVRVGNASVEKPIDTGFRRSIVTLREPNETGVAPEGWSTTYRVTGRAWSPGASTLEGVRVFGLAGADLPVNVTVETPGGETRFASSTDGFGDFDIEVVTDADPRDVSVRLEALGSVQTAPLSASTHRTTVPIYLPPHRDGGDVRASFPDSRAESVPGTTTPAWSPPLLSGVLLAIIGAVWLARRKAER